MVTSLAIKAVVIHTAACWHAPLTVCSLHLSAQPCIKHTPASAIACAPYRPVVGVSVVVIRCTVREYRESTVQAGAVYDSMH
jgi:hypothetical protein